MSRGRSSAAVIYRPDPVTGELVAVATGPVSGAKKAPRALRPIGVWNDLTQAWDVDPTTDYLRAVRGWCDETQDSSSLPAALAANGGPATMTRAEQDAFSRAEEEYA
jgi:hypothetical protein